MGDPLTLRCQIAGTPDISVAWFKADGKLRKSNTCSMDFFNGIATLKLSQTTKFDHAEYICKAENRVGSASASCNVTVKGDARFSFFSTKHPLFVYKSSKTHFMQLNCYKLQISSILAKETGTDCRLVYFDSHASGSSPLEVVQLVDRIVVEKWIILTL